MNIQLPTASCLLECLSGQIRRRLASNDSDLNTRVYDLLEGIQFGLAVLWLNKPVWHDSALWKSSLKNIKSSLGPLRDQVVLLDRIETLKYDEAIPDWVLSQESIDQLRQKLALNHEALLRSGIGHAQLRLFAFVDELESRIERDRQAGAVATAWMTQGFNRAVAVVINTAEDGLAGVKDHGKALYPCCQQVERLYCLLTLCVCCADEELVVPLHGCIQTARAFLETLALYQDYDRLIGHAERFSGDVVLYRFLQAAAKTRRSSLTAKLSLRQSQLVQTLRRLTDLHIEVA